MKIFECQSKAHKEFTSFFSYVSVFNQTRCIANHYYAAKVFKSPNGTAIFPEDWKESRKWAEAGIRQIGWKIGDFILPLRINNKGYKIDDFGVQWYILLWYKHLRENPKKLEYLQQFDKFNDQYKNKSFPFGQSDIMLKVKQDGLNSLRSMASELWNLLSYKSLTIDYNLLNIRYGFICHEVSPNGVITELSQQICERYPIVCESYQDSLLSCCLGDIRVIPISNSLSVVKLFTQVDDQTDVTALRQSVVKLADLQETSCPAPIYLPQTILDGISDNEASQVLSLIENHLIPVAICS
ncbi:hypothetical protein [Laspinema olomoucense]|uniref:Uncharacterized protein n=1 Tax=Laspinema olomoucense D3b TaxID=2953688 RepID=A0ABT2NCH1_9CYAN|nr:hypothetical protein [Laspinema sp. D3b]MCT7980396.1 hypothetical protein [Laspinema sp. D3b]